MSAINKLKNLLVDPDVNYAMKMINSNNYAKLSFAEKADILIAYNDALNAAFDHHLTLYINKTPSEEYEARSVSANMDEGKLIINGVNNNPYVCMRDLLLMQLSYEDIENYDYIQIGEVRYDENFVYEFPQLGFYNNENLKYLRASNKFINTLLTDTNNSYKSEFEKDFDNNLTKEVIEEIQAGYESMDNCLKRGVYDEMDDFSNKLGEMFVKDKLSLEELALLSLDEIATSYMHKEEELEDDINPGLEHYKQFINCFFKDYVDYIQIEFDDLGMVINGRDVSEDEIFMDVLMQEIQIIENNHHLIDNIVSDDILNRFNKKLNKNYSKLDCYFYSRLDILDGYLKNKKLEIINYNKWTSIYRNDKENSIYKDKKELFSDLIDNEEFISTVESYLSSKSKDSKSLTKIMNMMNNSYGANFKLILEERALADSSMGIADSDNHIYLNVDNVRDKMSLLITLFHEYRHLIQRKETKENSGVFNDYIYPYIKMENEATPCDNEYNYAELQRYGYINDKFYAIQPTEYDAELYAETFFKRIQEKMKIKKDIDYSMYVCDNYRSSVFIDSEKLSLESYKNYLIVNEIPQSKQEEEERYEIIKEAINKADSLLDAKNIIKDPMFMALTMKEKVKVYKLIAQDQFKIEYSKSKKIFTIDNTKYSTAMVTDYDMIEVILSKLIDKKIANGELKLIDKNKYIYNELKEYKYDNIEEFNCFAPHSYHKVLSKYSRAIKKENKNNKGAR